MKKVLLPALALIIFLGGCSRDTVENFNKPLSACEEIKGLLKKVPNEEMEEKFCYKLTIYGMDRQEMENYKTHHPQDQIFRFKDDQGKVKCLIFTNDYFINPGDALKEYN